MWLPDEQQWEVVPQGCARHNSFLLQQVAIDELLPATGRSWGRDVSEGTSAREQ